MNSNHSFVVTFIYSLYFLIKKRCGIRLDNGKVNDTLNITDEHLAENSLCFSTPDQNIGNLWSKVSISNKKTKNV